MLFAEIVLYGMAVLEGINVVYRTDDSLGIKTLEIIIFALILIAAVNLSVNG